MKKLIIGLVLFAALFVPNIVQGGDRPGNGEHLHGDKAQQRENQREAEARHDTCFPPGTKITMADGSTKNIEDIKVGESVEGKGNRGEKTINTVQDLFQPVSDNMCEIRYTDGESLKLTNGHPLYTQAGWKAIDPQVASRENPGVPVTRLLVGDLMSKENGSWPQVSSISCQNGSFQTYNFSVDNSHNYFAGGFLAHNKTVGNSYVPGSVALWNGLVSSGSNPTLHLDYVGGAWVGNGDITVWTCFPAGTKVLMSSGGQKNIEDVKVGDKVISQSEAGNKSVSTVTALDQPVRDHMCQINFEGGGTLKLTNEHPLYTKTGWKAIAPRKEAYADPNLVVTPLSKGDAVIKSDGATGVVESMSCWSETVQAYNLGLSGKSHTYFADGYLAHNKGGDGPDNGTSCNLGSPPTMTVTNPSDSSTKATVNWSDVGNATGESLFVGTDKTKVNSFCQNGVGPGTGCVVAATNIASNVRSYTTDDVLSPGTVYYWHLVVIYSGVSCMLDSSKVYLTSCNVIPSSLTLRPGETATLTTDVKNSSLIDKVTYVPTASNVTINPNVVSHSNYPYQTTVTGVSPTDNVKVNSFVKDPTGNTICTDWSDITVTPPPPWWQVGDSDVLSMGDLASNIPLLLPQKYFDLPGAYTNGFAGVPAYSGNTNLNNLPDTKNVSTVGWLAKSPSSGGKVYDYAYFANQIPSDVQYNAINAGDVAGSLESGTTHDANNYYWYKYDGSANRSLPLILPTTDIKNRKVILLIDNANLNITGNINVDDGVGFFMAIVGKGPSGTKGNILVDPAVGGGSGPNLEGIYLADNTFSDTSGDLRLHVRGSVVAYSGVYLYRNLGDSPNSEQSSEFFEYAPDQIMLFPSKLGTRRINWKEVAP